MTERVLTSLGRGGLFLGAAGFIPYAFLYDVDGGESAVMFNRFGGVSDKPIFEGTHFHIPWFQTPYIYDIRIKPKVINTTTGTRDLQMVSLSLRLLFKPHVGALPRIHKSLGPDYDERVLPSIGNEVLKSVVARYNAESLLTQRDKVSKDIKDAIITRAAHFDILLDDVAITHLSYGKEFSKAIEEKQVAQQESERVRFIVQKSEQEKLAAVVKAEGEAESATMISNSLKEHGTGLLELRKIEASKEIAEVLSQSRSITYIPKSMNALINLPQSA